LTSFVCGETISRVTDLSWLQRAQALGDVIASHRDEAERERRMPAALHDAMLEAGLFGMTLSKTYGGSQASMEDCIRVIEEISRHDGVTGWNLMIGMHMSVLADYLEPGAAHELYNASLRGMAGTFQPRGKAERVEGGYRVTGQWPFGSNCANADWLLGTAVVAGTGPPEPRICYFPVGECTILDTWHTVGLKGTGSNDFAVDNVFVPERHTFPMQHMFGGPQGNPDAMLRRPFFDIAAPTLAAVSLGIARDAIESFVAMAGSKTPARGTWTLGTMHSTHMQLGEAEALLRSARAYLYDVARQLDGPLGPDADATAADCRLASTNATHSAMKAVDIVYELAGSNSLYTSSRLERCFRDVHMPSHHAIASQSHYEMVGQYMLGHGLQMRR
jgi:alkylation response protein AidB-like acyl-CoA dehydrogenase